MPSIQEVRHESDVDTEDKCLPPYLLNPLPCQLQQRGSQRAGASGRGGGGGGGGGKPQPNVPGGGGGGGGKG